MLWFDSKKAVDDVLDKDNGLLVKFGRYVNDLSLTDAEILDTNTKTIASAQAFVQSSLNESTARSRSRRSIATLWIKVQLWIVLFGCISAPFDIALATYYMELATSTLMVSVTTAICIFFFGSYGLARHNETKGK